MMRSRLFLGLAVAAACLAAGGAELVFGQPDPQTIVTAPPPPVPVGQPQPRPAPVPGFDDRGLEALGVIPPAQPVQHQQGTFASLPQQEIPVADRLPPPPPGTGSSRADDIEKALMELRKQRDSGQAVPPAAAPISAAPPVAAPRADTDKEPHKQVVPLAHTDATPNEPLAGRQEPAVSIEWAGPTTARLGQPTSYQIIAKNISNASVYDVVVRHRLAPGVQVTGSEPKAAQEGTTLAWTLGTLAPGQEKRIDLQLVPETKTPLCCQAQVTFSSSAMLKVTVREPKLVVKTAAPEKVVLGDSATVAITITNPGDGVADRVKVKAVLPEGLEHARGKQIEVELGNLGAGESRTVQLVCLAKTAGMQLVDCTAIADAGLTSQDSAKLDVVLPRLDLAILGPKLRYLDRHAVYTLKVTNPGSAPASNVSLVHILPQGFKFHEASHGGRHDFPTRTITWFIGDLMPGQSREVTLEAVAVSPGEHKHRAVATAARGLKTEGDAVTVVEGLSALLMELVDTDDPVEVGNDTTYEIRITNTGSKVETNLELVCTVPEKMEFRGAKSSAGCRFRMEGRDVIFEPLARLMPRTDTVYRVTARGMAPGDMRFRARIRADGLSEPVLREESTKVYGDELPPR
jgi:uncharacterized repeat protein (TIGR01451 family)